MIRKQNPHNWTLRDRKVREQIAAMHLEKYPCGCQFIHFRDGSYDHFINPDCTLDAGKTTKLPAYRYKNWDSLPKSEGEIYFEDKQPYPDRP